MGFIKSLRQSISELPSAISNGSIYFIKATRAMFMDIGGERFRLNPPSDWNEENIDSPAFIQNKPQIGTAASYDIATEMDDSDSIPTNKIVNDAMEEISNRLIAMGSQKETCSLKADMIDTNKVYIYTGDEPDMQKGFLYYFDNVRYDWVPGWLYNSEGIQTDTSLTLSGEAADSKVVGDRIGAINGSLSSINTDLSEINSKLRDLTYTQIKVTSFTISPTEAEYGATINKITCNYNFNIVPQTAYIGIRLNNQTDYPNIQAITQKQGSVDITGYSFTNTSTIKLTGTDAGSDNNPVATATANVTLTFKYSIHYGIARQGALTNDFLLNELSTHKLSTNNQTTFTVDAGTQSQGFYIFYACPVSFGTPTFTVGILTGGFRQIGTFAHTNASGATNIQYQVWQSDNVGLGNTTIKVS